VRVEPAFEQGARGRIFRIRFEPEAGSVRGCVLCVPAFGEEMNKSRHVVAAAARDLAAAGFVVEVADLYGCGDSEGSLADATIEGWLEDLATQARRLADRSSAAVHLIGLRAGGLLATALAARLGDSAGDLVLWQPVARGRQVLTDFLRLRAAAGLFASGAARETADGLRERLRAGECLEVAGYPLGPELASGLEGLSLVEIFPGARNVRWIEIARAASGEPTPAVRKVVDAWRGRGARVAVEPLHGPPFWSAAELEDCPGLGPRTVARLEGAVP